MLKIFLTLQIKHKLRTLFNNVHINTGQIKQNMMQRKDMEKWEQRTNTMEKSMQILVQHMNLISSVVITSPEEKQQLGEIKKKQEVKTSSDNRARVLFKSNTNELAVLGGVITEF